MISEYKKRMFVGSLFVITFLFVCSAAKSDLLLDKQTESHFNKYLEQRNRLDGIEHLGGPYLRNQYLKTTRGTMTTYAYCRPLGIPGDPNQVSIETYLLNTPVQINASEIEILQKMENDRYYSQDDKRVHDVVSEIFKKIQSRCAKQWQQDESVLVIHSDVKGNAVKKIVEQEDYYCGIVKLDAATWQLYFRRGHRIFASDYRNDYIEFMPLTIIPADTIAAKSNLKSAANRDSKAWRADFFLYGPYEDSTLADLCQTLRDSRIPVAAIKFDGPKARAIYRQQQHADPFGHPYFNAIVDSAILKRHDDKFYCAFAFGSYRGNPGRRSGFI